MTADCLKLTAYFGERQRVAGAFAADALLDVLARHELATSVLLRGAEGFGARHRLRTDRLLTLSEDLPLVAVGVDERARVEAALQDVRALGLRGLVSLERARLAAGDLGAAGEAAAHEEVKLTLYLGRRERADGTVAFAAACDVLRRHGVAGATVLLGVDGTVHGRRVRAGFFGRNAEVPLMLIAVGAAAAIAGALHELDPLLHRPLATVERVRVCKRDGVALAAPHVPADGWQKLMVYTSEASRHGSRPVHAELVRRLRATGAAGATALRGIWGFHGDHAPHGDRLLQVRRRVPVVTVLVDRPDRIAAAFAIADELTGERGLVTSELVPLAETGTEA